MGKLRLVVAVVAMTGCYHQDTSIDTAYPEPTEVNGPPGGEMDPSWQAATYPAADPDQSAGYVATGQVEASADPSAPGYVMGEVTDQEIDTTLDGYGEWVDADGYGEVWRPYTTAVGVDFTPYETCGSWVWTNDWGWVYGCDWDWGWLPFHYGRWGWFDDYWAWVPDYSWSPAWVDWRGGGGYVGWRPAAPIIRDHRGHQFHHNGPIIRDHRTGTRLASQKESHWRFAATDEFGKHNIRAHLFKNPAEGLRVTSIVPRPPIRGTVQPVHAASVMHGRLATLGVANNGFGGPGRGPRSGQPMPTMHPVSADTPTWNRHPRPSSTFDQTPGGNEGVYAPGYSPTQTATPGLGGSDGARPVNEPGIGARPVGPAVSGGAPDGHPVPGQFDPGRGPSTDAVPQPSTHYPGPAGTYAPQAPSQPTWSPPSRPYTPQTPSQPTWSPPQRQYPSQAPSQPTWSPPQRQYPSQAPSQPTWSPPVRSAPTWSPPVRSAPSWSPPSHSSGGFSPSSGGFSPSHSSGGFSPSHSSGGFSPSHSSGGFSGGGSSGGHSSGGFSGGGGHSSGGGGRHR